MSDGRTPRSARTYRTTVQYHKKVFPLRVTSNSRITVAAISTSEVTSSLSKSEKHYLSSEQLAKSCELGINCLTAGYLIMSGEGSAVTAPTSFKKRQDDAKKKQSGEMAPDLDQDGKMINPHNPDFITKVPWYLGNSGPTLKHHNIQKSDHFLSLSESDQIINQKLQSQRSILDNQTQKTFKKGSCKNCGATTHKEKDCVERPRSTKKSAWKSGLDIAPDEIVLNLEEYGKVSFSAKRDQWKGWNDTT